MLGDKEFMKAHSYLLTAIEQSDYVVPIWTLAFDQIDADAGSVIEQAVLKQITPEEAITKAAKIANSIIARALAE